jgi:hypothetical protein
MASMSRAALLCNLVLLQLSAVEAFRRKRRVVASADAGGVSSARSSCDLPDFVYDGVRDLINGQIAGRLEDPLAVDLPAVEGEVSLWMCKAGLAMDSHLALTGLKGAGVSKLGCHASQCLETGLFGICTKREYTLEAGVSFGSVLGAAGYGNASWDLCGLATNDTTIDLGFDVVDSGVGSRIVVHLAAFPPDAEIVKVETLDIDWGTPGNFACGFEGLPSFIASQLERFCPTILGWVVEKAQEHLLSHVDALLKRLIKEHIVGPDGEGVRVSSPE